MQRIAAFSENAGAKAEHLDFQLLWKNGISSRSLGFSAKFQAAIELSLDVTQRQDVAQRDVAHPFTPSWTLRRGPPARAPRGTAAWACRRPGASIGALAFLRPGRTGHRSHFAQRDYIFVVNIQTFYSSHPNRHASENISHPKNILTVNKAFLQRTACQICQIWQIVRWRGGRAPRGTAWANLRIFNFDG